MLVVCCALRKKSKERSVLSKGASPVIGVWNGVSGVLS